MKPPFATVRKGWACLHFTIFLAVAFVSHADIADDPFSELWDAPVVDSSRPEDRLFQTPVGAFTLDEDAIIHLPVNSIPEMLRYAPGVHIQRGNNGVWGMGIRGMNSRFFGRTIFAVDEQNPYGDLFGGLFGSVHVMLLDDVSSIEVVRGPGGGLWGTNASNGMVNVIPKTAFETEGGHLLLRGGSKEQWGEARYGWSTGEKSAARVYALANHRDASFSDPSFDDSWDTYRVGMRYDRRPDDSSLLSLTAEAFGSELSAAAVVPDLATGILGRSTKPEEQSGLNAQAKWLKNFAGGGGLVTRAWVGQVDYEANLANFELFTLGVEARLEYPWLEGHVVSLTAGIIGDQADLEDSELLSFAENSLNRTQVKLGMQETWGFADHWSLSGGVTGLYDSYREAWYVQPELRLTFSPQASSVWWISAARALRTIPAAMLSAEQIAAGRRAIAPVTIPTPLGPQVIAQTIVIGRIAEGIEAEELNAYELGHRRELSESVSLGLSLFYNDYDQIAYGYVPEDPVPVLFVPEPYFAQTSLYDNVAKGFAYGAEVDLSWEISERVRLKLAYSFIETEFESIRSLSNPLLQMLSDTLVLEVQENTPQHLGSLWIIWVPLEAWRVDATLRYDDGFKSPSREVLPKTQLDFRITWEPDERWRCSVVGRNLLDAYTNEGGIKDFVGLVSEIEREVYVEVRYAF
jgi:iron complex outermembrane receptor protein